MIFGLKNKVGEFYCDALKNGVFSEFSKPLVDNQAEDQLMEAAIN